MLATIDDEAKERVADLEALESFSRLATAFAQANALAKGAAEVLLPSLAKRMELTRDIAVAAIERLGSQRLVVFIDDLDRMDHRLAPHLLMVLRDVLNIPPTVFVLALDPDVVSAGLSAVHPGWGASGAFLHKVIDYEFWLPQPTPDQLGRLTRFALGEAGLNVPIESLQPIEDLLPRNPRMLKRFIRGLHRFKDVLRRHDQADVPWTAILFLELLRIHAPDIAGTLLGEHILGEIAAATAHFRFGMDRDVLKAIAALFPADAAQRSAASALDPPKGLPGVVEPPAHPTLSESVNEMTAHDTTPRAEVLRLVAAFIERSRFIPVETLVYWGKCVQGAAPIVTPKEAREFGAVADGRERHEWIRKHALVRSETVADVIRALTQELVAARQQILDATADADSDKRLQAHLSDVGQVTAALRSLTVDLPMEFAGSIGPRELQAVYEHVAKWAHFTHKVFAATRDVERTWLFDMVSHTSPATAIAVLDATQALSGMPRVEVTQEATTLTQEFVARLLALAIPVVRGRFGRPGGIASLASSPHRNVEAGILFRIELGAYDSTGRDLLANWARQAADDVEIHANYVAFLQSLGYGLIRGGLRDASRDEIQALIRDRQVVTTLWSGAMAQGIPYRMHQSVVKIKAAFESSGVDPADIPLPAWFPNAP